MDWLDYREKLGIGFSDSQKLKIFLTKMFNALRSIQETVYGVLDASSYINFCNTTGTELDTRIIKNDYDYSYDRFYSCVNILSRHDSSLQDFLAYYVAFMNSVGKTGLEINRNSYKKILTNALDEVKLPYDLIEDNGQFFVFPKGVKEFDKALVSEPLEWLSAYPDSEKAWIKALAKYATVDDESASEVADQFRKALEIFFKEFFSNDKTLENNKAIYGGYIKSQGVPSEIGNNFETLLQAYTNFMNGYAKHHDKTEIKVLEYLMYQTGNIMRLLITLRMEEAQNAD